MTQNQRIEIGLKESLMLLVFNNNYPSTPRVNTNDILFWTTSILSEVIEVPYYAYVYGIQNIINDHDLTDANLTLGLKYNNNDITSYASMKTAFIRHGYNARRLFKIDVKGEIVYIAQGIILDKDLNVLFLLSRKHNIIDNTTNYPATIYINPSVFSRETKADKFIAGTLFTLIMGLKRNPAPDFRVDFSIVLEAENLLYSIDVPNSHHNINDNAWNIITEHLEGIKHTIM